MTDEWEFNVYSNAGGKKMFCVSQMKIAMLMHSAKITKDSVRDAWLEESFTKSHNKTEKLFTRKFLLDWRLWFQKHNEMKTLT